MEPNRPNATGLWGKMLRAVEATPAWLVPGDAMYAGNPLEQLRDAWDRNAWNWREGSLLGGSSYEIDDEKTAGGMWWEATEGELLATGEDYICFKMGYQPVTIRPSSDPNWAFMAPWASGTPETAARTVIALATGTEHPAIYPISRGANQPLSAIGWRGEGHAFWVPTMLWEAYRNWIRLLWPNGPDRTVRALPFPVVALNTLDGRTGYLENHKVDSFCWGNYTPRLEEGDEMYSLRTRYKFRNRCEPNADSAGQAWGFDAHMLLHGVEDLTAVIQDWRDNWQPGDRTVGEGDAAVTIPVNAASSRSRLKTMLQEQCGKLEGSFLVESDDYLRWWRPDSGTEEDVLELSLGRMYRRMRLDLLQMLGRWTVPTFFKIGGRDYAPGAMNIQAVARAISVLGPGYYRLDDINRLGGIRAEDWRRLQLATGGWRHVTGMIAEGIWRLRGVLVTRWLDAGRRLQRVFTGRDLCMLGTPSTGPGAILNQVTYRTLGSYVVDARGNVARGWGSYGTPVAWGMLAWLRWLEPREYNLDTGTGAQLSEWAAGFGRDIETLDQRISMAWDLLGTRIDEAELATHANTPQDGSEGRGFREAARAAARVTPLDWVPNRGLQEADGPLGDAPDGWSWQLVADGYEFRPETAATEPAATQAPEDPAPAEVPEDEDEDEDETVDICDRCRGEYDPQEEGGNGLCATCYDEDYFHCTRCAREFETYEAYTGHDGDRYCRGCYDREYPACIDCDERVWHEDLNEDGRCNVCHDEHRRREEEAADEPEVEAGPAEAEAPEAAEPQEPGATGALEACQDCGGQYPELFEEDGFRMCAGCRDYRYPACGLCGTRARRTLQVLTGAGFQCETCVRGREARGEPEPAAPEPTPRMNPQEMAALFRPIPMPRPERRTLHDIFTDPRPIDDGPW